MDELSVLRRFPAPGRNPAGQVLDMEFCGGGASLADMTFGFFEEGEESPESESSEEADTEGDGEDSDSIAQRKIFWEAQHQLLKGTLYRTSSLETRIRQDSEEALRESRSVGTNCVCQKPVSGGCRNCLLTDVTERLRNAGHDAAVCNSKWRSSPGIPSGEHRYVEVMGPAKSGKSQVRVVIEMEFRAEFEMARASPEYKQLINHLPAVFVGKAERLKNLIKILSGAAKKCMKETHMHLPPWRKNKYMQAKWVATSERIVPERVFSAVLPDQRSKRRASMLTFDLSDTLPTLHHCSAVAVV